MYQLDQNIDDLPPTQQQWLLGPLPNSVKYFCKDPELGFAILLLPLLWLPLLIFGGDTLYRVAQQQRLDQGNIISGLLVTIPLALWSLLRFIKSYQNHQKLKAGVYKIGVFFDAEQLLWCENFKTCHLIRKSSLLGFEVTGRPVHRAGWFPDEFVLWGEGFKLRISNASAYYAFGVFEHMQNWHPEIVCKWDQRLNSNLAKQPTSHNVLKPAEYAEAVKKAKAYVKKSEQDPIVQQPNRFAEPHTTWVTQTQIQNMQSEPQNGLEAERLLFALLVYGANHHMGTQQGVEDGKPFVIYYFSERPKLNAANQKRLKAYWIGNAPDVLQLRGHNGRRVICQGIGDDRYPIGQNKALQPRPLRAWSVENAPWIGPSAITYRAIPTDFAPIHTIHFKNLLESCGINYFMDHPMRHATAFTAPEEWVFDKPLKVPLHFLRPILADLAMGNLRDWQNQIDAEDWGYEVEIGKSGLYFEDWSEWRCYPEAFV